MSVNKGTFYVNYFAEKNYSDAYNCYGWRTDTAYRTGWYLAPGTTLHKKHLIVQVLGYSGFGITCLALDLNLHAKLVVKEYLPRDIATRSFSDTTVTPYTGPSREHFEFGLKKFLEEARALARFEDSPGIVSVKDFFQTSETGDRPWNGI